MAIKIILAELVLEIIYIVLKLSLHYFEDEGIIVNALGLGLALNILMIPLAVLLIIVPVAYWVSEEYILKETELIAKHGLISTKQTAYPYNGMQRIHVRQGPTGRLFNFGTVLVYMPVLGQEIRFNDLSNPHSFADLLKGRIPAPGQNQFLLRRS